MRLWCASLAAALLCGSLPLVSVADETIAASPPAAATPPAGETEDEDHAFQQAAKSYKLVQRDGQAMYCRREKPLGSRLPVQSCLTEAQLRASVRTAEDVRDKMRLPGAAPCGTKIMKC